MLFEVEKLFKFSLPSISFLHWCFNFLANTKLSSIFFSFQHESFFSESLCLAVQVNLGMTRFTMFKGSQTISECLVFWTMLCIVYKLKYAWLGGRGGRLGRVNYVATGTKYCFICTCMQSKKTRNGKNTTQEAVLGGIYWKLWMTMQLPVFIQ